MKINQFNYKGNKNGYWELNSFYPKKWISVRGYFSNGIKIGYWEFYDVVKIYKQEYYI